MGEIVASERVDNSSDIVGVSSSQTGEYAAPAST